MHQITRHWHQLTVPHATDDDLAHREYLTKVIMIMMGGTLSVFTLIIFGGYLAGQFVLLAPAIILATDLPILGGLWLAQRGRWLIASYIPPAITFAIAAYLNSISGSNTTGYFYYILAILLTAMLIGIKAQWLMVAMVMASSLFFGMTRWGLTPIEFLPDLILISAASIGAGLLQWVSTNQLKRWLTQSREFSFELSERTVELSDANLELRQTGERLKILHQVDQAVLAAQSPEEIAQAVVSHIRRLSACQRSSIALFDLKTEQVMILAVDYKNTTEFNNGKRFPLNEFGGIEELTRGQHRLINNLQTFSPLGKTEEKLIREGIKAILNVPLLVHGNLIGSLNLGADKPDAFRQKHIDIAYELAGSLAVALQNARLFQETRAQAKMLASLNEVALETSSVLEKDELIKRLYKQVDQILIFDTFVVALYVAETDELRIEFAIEDGMAVEEWIGMHMPAKESGLTGWVLKERQSLLVNNLEHDSMQIEPKRNSHKARSWLGVPMITRDRVIGALSVQSYQADAFNESQLHFMESLASQVAVSLENAALFAETQQRFNHLLALRMIDRAITSSPELSLILDILLDQVLTQLNVNAASVLLYSEHTHTLDFVANRGFRTNALQGTHLSIGEGHAGKAALDQRIVQIDNLAEFYGEFHRSLLLYQEGFQTYFAVPLIAKGQVKGVLEIFHRSALRSDQDWMDLLDALATQTALAIDNARLFENLQSANIELIKAYDATIEGWSRALDLRDEETEGHSQRVTRMTLRLARTMGVRPEELVNIQRGALLHDIGKMGIPDRILLKPAPLTNEEWKIMRQHPVFAYQLLSPIEYLRPALEIPYCHHERWDGSGYPRGLKGEQIPLAARIFAVIDVWDALNSARPYREAWEKTKILEHVASQAGAHFDPRVAKAFLQLLERTAIPDASILLASD